MQCLDFLEFQENLKKMRDMDDKIIYTLNTTLPTSSFRDHMQPTNMCKDLFQKLNMNYERREASIKECISVYARKVQQLKNDSTSNEDPQIAKQLRKESVTLRMLKSEVNVEEVIKERTLKVFHERCRQFYRPPQVQ